MKHASFQSPLEFRLVEVICSRTDRDNWAVGRGAEIYDGSEAQVNMGLERSQANAGVGESGACFNTYVHR